MDGIIKSDNTAEKCGFSHSKNGVFSQGAADCVCVCVFHRVMCVVTSKDPPSMEMISV